MTNGSQCIILDEFMADAETAPDPSQRGGSTTASVGEGGVS